MLMLVSIPLVLAGVAENHFPTRSGVEVAAMGGSEGRHAGSPPAVVLIMVSSVGGKSEADSKAGGS